MRVTTLPVLIASAACHTWYQYDTCRCVVRFDVDYIIPNPNGERVGRLDFRVAQTLDRPI